MLYLKQKKYLIIIDRKLDAIFYQFAFFSKLTKKEERESENTKAKIKV